MVDKSIVHFQKKVFDILNKKDGDTDPNKKVHYTEFKSHLYKYEYGSGILMHQDHAEKSDATRYGISFYLNDEWNANWGGELIVYEDNEPSFPILNNDGNPLTSIFVVITFPPFCSLLKEVTL